MKVMLYAYAPIIGGVLRHVLELARQLRAQGVRASVVMNRGPSVDAAVTEMESDELPVSRVAIEGRADMAGMRRFVRVLDEQQPDLVHMHTSNFYESLAAMALCAWRRVPLLLTEHQPFFPERPGGLKLHAKRMLLRRARAVVLLGPSMVTPYREMSRVPEERIAVIPPFSRLLPDVGVGEELRTIGFVGELNENKGVDRLLEFAPLLAERGYRLLLFGRGPLRSRAEQVGAALAGAVQVSEFGADPAAAYAQMDALILLSGREGLPLVVLEAISAGVPVLATKAGVLPDYFADGQGIRYLDRVSDEQVLEKMDSLRDRKRRHEIVASGRALIESSMTPALLTKRLVDLYHRSIKDARGR